MFCGVAGGREKRIAQRALLWIGTARARIHAFPRRIATTRSCPIGRRDGLPYSTSKSLGTYRSGRSPFMTQTMSK